MPLTLLRVPSAISSILGTWLDQYSEDFCQPPDFPCLKQLVAYVQLNMPGSDLERRAHLLLAQLEDLEPREAESEGEEPGVATQSLLGGSVKVSTTERLQPPSQEQEQAWGPVGSTPESGIPSCCWDGGLFSGSR